MKKINHCYSLFTLIFSSLLSLSVNAGGLPDTTVPSSMSIQLKDGDGTEQGLDLIQEAGFKMMRRGIYWSKVETKKGVYNFAGYDTLLNSAAQRGLWLSITLYSSNSLYETGSIGITTAAGRAGFAKFAAATVSRYKGKNIIWEVWNEPNLGGFWKAPSNSVAIADEYTALVKEVVPAIKAADPSAFVVAGSISSLWSASFKWFDRCIQQGILKTGINGISVHPYGFSWPELAAKDGYTAIRSKMDAAGAKNLRIVNTEVGYHIGFITERQGFSEQMAAEVQGWHLVRQQMIDLMSNIGYSNWYEFREDSGWGLVKKDFTPSSSFYAAKNMVTQMKGYKFVKKLPTTSDLDYILLFETAAKKQKLVAWTTPLISDPAAHRQPKNHNLDIPVVGTGSVKVTNIEGGRGNLTVKNGLISLLVEGAPKYIDLSTLVTSAPKTNVALNKSVTASSGNGARLTDGIKDNVSRWFSDSGYPQNFEIDLKGTFEISEIHYLQFTARTIDYRIEVLSGGKWKVVSSGTDNKDLNIIKSFTPVSGTKVKFTILKGSLYQKAFEFEVIGSAQ